jgi:RNA polymerase sigma-70 factor (ECF subfamily)
MSLETEVEQAYEEGKRMWPDVTLTLAQFRDGSIEAGVKAFGAWAGDFYLARAAVNGDTAALRHIDAVISTLSPRIRRLGTPPHAVPDVLQAVRERLFSGQSPRIRRYDATTALAQWTKVVAIRVAIDLHRREVVVARLPGLALSYDEVASGNDAEAQVMREEYRTEFERALREVLGTLEQRDRTVMRLHLAEQVDVDRIATMYRVHRMTVTRWIRNAGEIVLAGLRKHFRERFGIELMDFDSMARLVRSRLSLNLGSLLGGTAAGVSFDDEK